MVNTGRPSRGCDLCRKRKIKCDEAKPSCRNCRKYGKDCPGYRIETPPMSRDTSSDGWKEARRTPDTLREAGRGSSRSPAIQKAIHSTTPELNKRKVQAQQMVWDQFQETKYSTTSLAAYQDDCFAWSPPPMAWSLPSLTIFPEPQDNLEDQAISYLYGSGVLNIIASNISDVSTADFICEMCRETSVTSSLNQAVLATALANFANRTYRPDLHLRAHDQYGEALTALKIALADPQKCLEDQTLATLLILRICETLFAFNATHSTASSNIMPLDDWQSHIEGMHALLRMRGVTQLSTQRGRWLFEVVSKAVGLRSIMTCQKPDESLCRLENEFNLQRAGPLWPLASCSTFYLQTASKIRAQIRDLIEQNRSYRNYATFAGEMDTLVRGAEELDARLEGWLKRNEHWQALKTPPAETFASGVDAASLAQYYFTDPVVLLYRGRISFTRVKLHESVISGLSAKLEVLERELQYQSSSTVTSSAFAVIDKEIMAHVQTLQRNAAAILGWVACGLDDLDEEGRFVEVAGWPRPLALGLDDGTKLGLRTIEIYVHLAGLQRCDFITEAQMQVSGRVLERIVDSFRAPLV